MGKQSASPQHLYEYKRIQVLDTELAYIEAGGGAQLFYSW